MPAHLESQLLAPRRFDNDRYEIRTIENVEELKAAFALRYSIFEPMNVIPDEYNSRATRLELDNFDKYSIPLGCFLLRPSQALVGQVRLITTSYDHRFDRLTWQMVEQAEDRELSRVFDAPYTQELPVFESFPLLELKRYLLRNGLKYCELSRIVVLEKERGHGVASKLIVAALDLAKSQRMNVVLLGCAEENTGFYERFGFEVLDTAVTMYHRIGKPSLAMRADL
ncbi:MAG: GNAT family N-acetyltransferase [Gammaproteobacteria bacterium]|nr:GNAT family N-acetyltransferase [Gammaproteobacteria bacterium]